LLQLVSNPLAFRLGSRHTINESADIVGEIVAAILRKQIGDRAPSAFDGLPCFCEFVFTGLDVNTAFDSSAAPPYASAPPPAS
jgi:hypothetical protein